MTPRAAEILTSIVKAYIETGHPVASRSVARRRCGTALSPATIRNVMADLYDEGYLTQPHTSAGRVPTEKAFRYYVHSLNALRLPSHTLERLRSEFRDVRSLDQGAERSSHVLTELTRNMGITAAIPNSGQILDQIELLTLADQRVLMIVITRDGVVRNRVVTTEQPTTQDELNSIRNYMNRNFSGWALLDVRRELEQRFQQESAAYDAILRRLTDLCGKGLLELDLSPEVYTEGAANLVALDLHLTREKTRELFRALEEKKKIIELLDRFLERPSGMVGVQVGLGDVHAAMRELSLIGLNVTLPSGKSVRLAVLGPMCMNYEQAMSVVLQVGQALQSIRA